MRPSPPIFAAFCLAAAATALPAQSPAPPREEDVARRVDALLARMTIEEKVGQLVQAGAFPGMDPEGAVRRGAGSVLWLNDTRRFDELQRIAVEETRLGIPLLFALDVIHGYRTIFPSPIGMAATWDPATWERAQEIAAREARAAGIHWTFAPMVDVARDARWGRIVEGAGEDPFLGAAMAAAQTRGLQGPWLGSPERLMATAKHFAGYGAAEGGRDYDPVYLSETQLRNVHLPPFRAAVAAGAGALMSAYMDLNDVPAAANPWLLRQVLREEWGFEGLVVSDAFSVRNLLAQGLARDGADAARRALAAGLDVDMAGEVYATHLAGLVASGEVPIATLDAAVRRVLSAKVRMGLFESPYAEESRLAAVLADPAHRAHARLAAQRSLVLLRNEGGALPLRPSAGTIAVVGPLAESAVDTEGAWMVFGHQPAAVTVLAGIRAAAPPGVAVTHAPGPRMRRDILSFFQEFDPRLKAPPQPPAEAQAAFEEAVATARAADLVVLVLGETADMSGEAASRSSLALPGRQQELLEAVVAMGKPVALVLLTGRPLALGWAAEHVPAILLAWQPGSEGGHAVADALFGRVNPGGKLPVTFPREAAHSPLYYARVPTHDPEGGPTHRARYWDGAAEPLFPFGHGLSYTTFAYSDLRVTPRRVEPGETATVSVSVANSGSVAGDEVVQLYLHQRWGSDSRPRRELKGFERVTLAPGEKRTVTFRIGPDELRYWSTSRGDWTQDAALFDVWAGGDSRASEHAELAVGVEPSAPARAATAPVATDAGPVVGTAAEGVASFLGIPYAAPPVGELRWRAPRPAAPWTEPLVADEYGSDCMQLPYPGDGGPTRTRLAEDCLYLNVWAPEPRGEEPLPVMVWIPGGGFVNGGSSPAVNDGAALARRGVVLVSLNYRLGRFGFFAHPALQHETAGAPSGNWGFLDQIAALDWVRRNAAAFGGDPGNVTIFGESAGGASVQALMVSPLARGLFHKALVQSGGGRLGGILALRPLRGEPVAGLPSAEAAALAFAREAGIEGEDAAALAALRALPAERLVNGMTLLAPQPATFSGPMVDGAIVPEDVEPAFRAGRQARVPYLVGTTDREFGFAPVPDERSRAMFAAFGADREAAERAYDPAGAGDRSEMAIQLQSDQAMVEPARLLARLASATQPTWSYRFSYVATSLRAVLPGALHASEVAFAFDTVREAYGDATTAEDEAMADAMAGYWVDFARSGDPNGGGRPRWPGYSPAEDAILDLAVGGPVATPDPRRARLDLVERLADAAAPR